MYIHVVKAVTKEWCRRFARNARPQFECTQFDELKKKLEKESLSY